MRSRHFYAIDLTCAVSVGAHEAAHAMIFVHDNGWHLHADDLRGSKQSCILRRLFSCYHQAQVSCGAEHRAVRIGLANHMPVPKLLQLAAQTRAYAKLRG